MKLLTTKNEFFSFFQRPEERSTSRSESVNTNDLAISPSQALPNDDAPSEQILSNPPDTLTYTEQVLPNVGVQFDVNVTQVDRPDLVYIQVSLLEKNLF